MAVGERGVLKMARLELTADRAATDGRGEIHCNPGVRGSAPGDTQLPGLG